MSQKKKIDNMKKLSEFIKEYLLLNELKDEYQRGESNRKALSKIIMTKTAKAKELIQEVGDSLVIFEYENQDKISDCRKVLEILLELANQNGEKYQIKEVYNREWCNEEDRRFYENRPEKSKDNTSLIIAKKEALEELDDNKVLWFGEYMKRMLSEKYSIVITVKSHRPTNIMSDDLDGNKHEFKLDYVREEKNGEFSNIGCYTFDDELNDAVNMLCEYINIYGGDLEGISINTIIARVKELEQEKVFQSQTKQKKLKQTKAREI